jgi:hypothetical protein
VLRGFFRIVGEVVGAVFRALITKPIKERGLLWTIAAWVLAVTTLAFWCQLGKLLGLGVVWVLAVFLFYKLHTRPRRSTRPLPYRRRR